jgi:hypothetical protein
MIDVDPYWQEFSEHCQSDFELWEKTKEAATDDAKEMQWAGLALTLIRTAMVYDRRLLELVDPVNDPTSIHNGDKMTEYSATIKRQDLIKPRTAEQIAASMNAPPFDGKIRLNAGECEAEYPKGFYVHVVNMVGMRGRGLKLKRVRWDDLARYARDLRGLPTCYALEFRDRKVRVWPAPINGIDLVLEHGELEPEVEDMLA